MRKAGGGQGSWRSGLGAARTKPGFFVMISVGPCVFPATLRSGRDEGCGSRPNRAGAQTPKGTSSSSHSYLHLVCIAVISPLKGKSPQPRSRLLPAETFCSRLCQPRRRAGSSGHSRAPLAAAPGTFGPSPVPASPRPPETPAGFEEPRHVRRLLAGGREAEGRGVLFRLLWDVEFWKMFPELPEAKFISPGPGGRRDPGDD